MAFDDGQANDMLEHVVLTLISITDLTPCKHRTMNRKIQT